MKKLLYVAIVGIVLTFASCGNKVNSCTENDSTSVDTTVVDSAVVDTAAVDTL